MPLHRAELQGHAALLHAQAHAGAPWASSRIACGWCGPRPPKGSSWPRRSTGWSRTSASWVRCTGRPTGAKTAIAAEALESIAKEHEEAMEVAVMIEQSQLRQDQGQAGHLLGRLLRRMRDLHPADRREDPRRGRRLRHGLLPLHRRRQGPRRGEDARRRRSTSACSTAASAPASRSTWPSCSAASRRSLVAFGSCASEGCIPGLANLNDRQRSSTRSTRRARPPRRRTPQTSARSTRRKCPRARSTCRCSTTR